MQGIPDLAEELLASHEGPCCMELAAYCISIGALCFPCRIILL
jgi:hypothetical protein